MLNLIKSFFTFNYYLGVLLAQRRFNPFLGVFLMALSWVGLASIGIFTAGFVFANGFSSQVVTIIDRVYPQELEIEIKQGIVQTNVTEPYYVNISSETFKGTFLENKEDTSVHKERILTIDTKAKAEDFDKYQTYALLTQENLVYYNEKKVRIESLSDIENLKISKNIIIENFNKQNKQYNFDRIVQIGLYILPFVLLIMFYIGISIMVVFYSLFIFLIMKIFNAGASFNRAIIFTSSLLFIPYIAKTLISFIPNQPPVISKIMDLYFVVILIFAYYIIRSVYGQKEIKVGGLE
ncbi:MAG: hypothetical protein M3P33_00965 [bacterium]|nr:hypothetical protein [bacterium]